MALMRPLSEIRDQMDRIFNDMEFQLPSLREWRPFVARELMHRTWLPPIDITEQDNQYQLRVELPGIRPEDLKVEVLNDSIIIQGETKEEHAEEKKNYYHRECRIGNIYRQVALPGTVRTEGAIAELKHGILTLRLPKQEERKGKQIQIQTR